MVGSAPWTRPAHYPQRTHRPSPGRRWTARQHGTKIAFSLGKQRTAVSCGRTLEI